MKTTTPTKQSNFVPVLAGVVGTILCLCVLVIAWAAFSAVDTPDEYVQEYGGSRAVYVELLALDNCQELQTRFDLAAADNQRHQPGSKAHKYSTGYMTAADQRMKAIGCYK
jgi:hypothetical protein